MMHLLFIALAWLTLSSAATAASFDCDKAATNVEKLICSDADLSKLDDEMAVAYKTGRQEEKQAEAVRKAQKGWLKERNSCSDAGCVKRVYETRLASLKKGRASVGASEAGPAVSQNQTNAVVSAEPEIAQKPQKLRYAFCDKSKPELSCEGQTGKGYTVCETYLKHLQTLTTPPSCEAPIPPGFKKPDWQELDITKNLELAYQVEASYLQKFRAFGYKRPDFDTWREALLKEIEEGKISPRLRKVTVTPYPHDKVTLLAYTRDRDACHKGYEYQKWRNVEIEKLPANTPEIRVDELVPVYPGWQWSDPGDVHFVLSDSASRTADEILGGIFSNVSSKQTELLLYANRAYFVEITAPLASINPIPWGDKKLTNSPFGIFVFNPGFPIRPAMDAELSPLYLVDERCQILPY